MVKRLKLSSGDRIGCHDIFWITLIGAYGVFFPMHFVGLAGAPRRYYNYTSYGEFDTDAYAMILDLNVIITVFAIIAAAGQAIFLFNFFYRHLS